LKKSPERFAGGPQKRKQGKGERKAVPPVRRGATLQARQRREVKGGFLLKTSHEHAEGEKSVPKDRHQSGTSGVEGRCQITWKETFNFLR